MHPEIINVTPHSLTFARPVHPADCGECARVAPDICGDAEAANVLGDTFEVVPSGVVISATPAEEVVGSAVAGTLVRTTFSASATAEEALTSLEAAHPGAIIVGSVIAAQAFPGRVLALVPAAGFERLPPPFVLPAAARMATEHGEWAVAGGLDLSSPTPFDALVDLIAALRAAEVAPAKRMRADKFTTF